ncbi:ThiF family adenylyltransferase [Lysinimonas soli]|uniref:ThiF family adenylyltransferase n=1 Tax=Lysinimonas soli TaxID=1074233 RepID=A0ABW0NVI7_9MICO
MTPVDPDSPRFLRQRVLGGFGVEAQRRLAEAHVLVIGAGGLGSAVIPALAAAGVGTIAIVDDDTVEASNLARQTIHGAADVGRSKVDSAADAVARLSPETTVIRHDVRFASQNSFELLLDADILVDGSDTFATRYLANDAAAIRGIPMVWGSAAQYSGQVGVAWDEKGVDYRDLFPVQPSDDEALSCELVGVLPTVCAVIGAMMANEAIKLITGVGEPLLGRVASFDALSGSTREIAYARDPNAPRPGSLEERTTLREPEPARSVTAAQLAKLLAGPTTAGIHETPPLLLDVREASEASFVSLPGSVLIPLGSLPDRLGELDQLLGSRDAPIVVYCHHGVRSARALDILEKTGFTRARHLTGGIDAWASQVEPQMARY